MPVAPSPLHTTNDGGFGSAGKPLLLSHQTLVACPPPPSSHASLVHLLRMCPGPIPDGPLVMLDDNFQKPGCASSRTEPPTVLQHHPLGASSLSAPPPHTHTHTYTPCFQDVPESVPDGPLVMVGDDHHSRLCLVNDTTTWGEVMTAKGLGECPRAAQGRCNCSRWVWEGGGGCFFLHRFAGCCCVAFCICGVVLR